jgi:pimeloyl-ACP methyl ester carboxylesterase
VVTAHATEPLATAGVRAEQSRACYPHTRGWVRRNGGRIWYEVYGAGEPTVMFVPPWQIVHSRIWKAQIPWFSRRHRVIAWDARGNGRSDRPADPAVHTAEARAADLLAVLDATDARSAIIVSLSAAARPTAIVAAEAADRVLGAVFIAPAVPFGHPIAGRDASFEDPLEDDEAWNRENIHSWRRDYRGYLEFFFGQALNEPHSTKQHEDAVGYGLETDPETLASTVRAGGTTADLFRDLCGRIRCPVLIIQGDRDAITGVSHGTELAAAIPGARLVVLAGAGHIPNARQPVVVNRLVRQFIDGLGFTR